MRGGVRLIQKVHNQLIWNGYPEFVKNVLGAFDQHRPLAQQLVAAARLGGVDGARNGEDRATLLAGVARGDELAAFQGRFDHQHAERETADDAISLREMMG